ncbi:MAG TPA: cation:proton antiporter [Solirubrobacteraceae bacterium]|nr:cation:proton antiporter [Solirubrobacteraceae bacterium]
MRALAYLFAGLGISLGLGLSGAGHLGPLRDHGLLREVCDVALIVSVFASGLAVERAVARSSWRLIGLLLAVGIPVTIAAVAGFAALGMGLGLGAAMLLGAVLAPTDPVLAGDLGLGPPGGPELGEPRLSLHTEAGANDGLAAPFVVGALLLAGRGDHGWVGHWLVVGVLLHVAEAVVIGVLAGRLAVHVARPLAGRSTDRRVARLALAAWVLGVAFAVYAACEPLHAYGLVGVFAAGFAFRRAEHDERLHSCVHEVSEPAGRMTELVAVVLIGALLTTHGLAVPGVGGWLLAPVVIVIVRPLLVLALTPVARAPLSLGERLYLGVFGVRGVAAVYYAAVVAGTHALAPHETAVVVWTTLVCVAVSILVHGLAAGPLRRRWLGEP